VARLRKTSGVDPVLALHHGNHLARYQVAHLAKHGMLTPRWPGRSALAGARRLAAPWCFGFHRPVDYRSTASRPALFLTPPVGSLWDASELKTKSPGAGGASEHCDRRSGIPPRSARPVAADAAPTRAVGAVPSCAQTVENRRSDYSWRLRTRVALWPPKPKELLMQASTLSSRALFGTQSRSHSGSGFS